MLNLNKLNQIKLTLGTLGFNSPSSSLKTTRRRDISKFVPTLYHFRSEILWASKITNMLEFPMI